MCNFWTGLGRRIKLTDAGDVFYDRATAALDAINDARTCVQTSLDWQKGTITDRRDSHRRTLPAARRRSAD